MHTDLRSGFVDERPQQWFEVDFPPELLARVPADRREALLGVLAHDPRPRFLDDPQRVFGLPFAGLDVRFTTSGSLLRVVDVQALRPDPDAAWPGYR